MKISARTVTCICIHGLFVQDALKKLRKIGAKVISTNTIENPVSKIDVSGVMAENV